MGTGEEKVTTAALGSAPLEQPSRRSSSQLLGVITHVAHVLSPILCRFASEVSVLRRANIHRGLMILDM